MILVDSPTYHSSRVGQDPTMRGHRRAACSRCTGRGPRTADPRDCTFSASLAHVDLRVQFRTGCVEGKPSPTCASAISWAIPWAMPRSPGRNPSFPKPPLFVKCAGGPFYAVTPHSCIVRYSRERRIRPTDIKLSRFPSGAARLPPRWDQARWRKGSSRARWRPRRSTPGPPK